SGRTRAPRTASPAQPMLHILLQGRAADMVFDHIRRENYAVSSLSRELAQDKIFRQIILQPLEASDRLQHRAAGGNRRAYGEAHAFKHPRDQSASPKIGVH